MTHASIDRVPPNRNRIAIAGDGDPQRLLRLWSRAEFLEARIAELESEEGEALLCDLRLARDYLREGEAGPAMFYLRLIQNALRTSETAIPK